jgi:hypothetical protein
MKWIQISAVPDSEASHFCLWALNEHGELWLFIPKRNIWYRQRDPNDDELAEKAEGSF